MDTIKQDSVRFVQFCIQFASLTLVYYDYLLTLGREVQYVWRRKFHVLTVIFFFCRYSTISNVVFLFGLVHKFDKISCDTAYLISAVLSIFGRIGVLTVLGVRTCAVYRNNRAIVALFTVMGLFVIALAIAHAPRVSCSGQKVKESRIATDLLCVFTVVYEIFATALLAFGCYRNIHDVGTTKEQKKGLMYLMLKEGLLYSGFVTLFTTTAMVLNYAAPLGSFWQRLLNALTIPISGLMSARFILHVREWHDRDLHEQFTSTGALASGIRFQFPQSPDDSDSDWSREDLSYIGNRSVSDYDQSSFQESTTGNRDIDQSSIAGPSRIRPNDPSIV